jgi:phosphoribosylformylglycinamidine cyclo-ligase
MPLIEAQRVRALAHVTGGGIAGNLVRVLPEGVRARVDPGAWPRPAVFRWLIEAGGVPEDDARVALNLGLGMLAIVERAEADAVERGLVAAGETVWTVGELIAGDRGVDWSPA